MAALKERLTQLLEAGAKGDPVAEQMAAEHIARNALRRFRV